MEHEQAMGEATQQYLMRLRELVKQRREEARESLEVLRHLDATLAVSMPAGVRLELLEAARRAATKVGKARGRVDIAEARLVTLLATLG